VFFELMGRPRLSAARPGPGVAGLSLPERDLTSAPSDLRAEHLQLGCQARIDVFVPSVSRPNGDQVEILTVVRHRNAPLGSALSYAPCGFRILPTGPAGLRRLASSGRHRSTKLVRNRCEAILNDEGLRAVAFALGRPVCSALASPTPGSAAIAAADSNPRPSGYEPGSPDQMAPDSRSQHARKACARGTL